MTTPRYPADVLQRIGRDRRAKVRRIVDIATLYCVTRHRTPDQLVDAPEDVWDALAHAAGERRTPSYESRVAITAVVEDRLAYRCPGCQALHGSRRAPAGAVAVAAGS